MKPHIILILLGCLTLSASAERPNILFIMTDQHFADVMSNVMGSKYVKTPNLDRLVAEGVRFDRAYAPNPLCRPARNAIFTGHYPFQTGIQSNRAAPLSKDIDCMGAMLREAGYATGYFGKWHLNIKTSDSKRHGFDEMGVLQSNGADHKIPPASIEFLKRKRDKPFLLVTSFTSPHDICQLCRGQKIPSGPIGELPSPEECPPAPKNLGPVEDETDTMKLMRASYTATKMTPVANFSPGKWRQMRWGYYRLVERADREIGNVLDALRDAGLEEKTLILFTADHGDCTGAHGFAQKTVFYDESARVPMVLTRKGTIAPGTTTKLVNVGVDILPTILEAANIAIPPHLKGRSLLPVARNPNLEDWREFIVVSNDMVQGTTPPGGTSIPMTRGRMVRSDAYKYGVYDLGEHRESLIHMVKDPLEMRNQARNPEYAGTLDEHRKWLRNFAEENGDKGALEIMSGQPAVRKSKKKKKK